MSTIFILDTDNYRSTPLDQVVARIRKINPDKIIIDCETECDVDIIFKELFDSLESWLEKNNKIINALTPHLDNVHIRSRVIGENGYANTLLYLSFIIMNRPDMSPPNSYYLPNSVAPYYGNLDEKHFDVLYTCYNNKPTLHREIMVDRLARDNLLTEGIVTFRYPEHCDWRYHDGSRLFDEPDYTLHSSLQYQPDQFPRSFHKGFFDIVGESQPNRFHITEKTLKSIAMFKPFLVNGCKDFHNKLFDFIGLKPYTELFDYSFDSCNLMEDRIEGIIDNVKRLSKLTVPERQQLYKDIIPKLIYNKSKMVEIMYNKEKIVPKSLQCLMDGNTHHVYGHSYTLLHMQQMGWIKKKVTWVN